MGLDGISINQLRVTQENNSAELNNQARFNLNNDSRAIDGLSQGHRIDPNQEKEKEKQEQKKKSSDDENDTNQEDEDVIDTVETIKYDLSKSDKYSLKIDNETNCIYIIDKATKEVVQSISAEQMSRLVGYLSNPQGSIISKRY